VSTHAAEPFTRNREEPHAKNVGLWGDTNVAWTDVLDEEIPTVGTMLREQGYYTAFKGTWHLSHPARSSEALEGYGFSDYQSWGDNWGAPLHGAQLDGTVAFETVDWLRHKRPRTGPGSWSPRWSIRTT
jgi:arylsulfatase A-like enzyme